MSRSRDKGNRLEKVVMPLIHKADGVDLRWTPMQTSTGRIGNTYHLQVDGISMRFAVECKNQESLADRLWLWLDHIPSLGGKIPLLVLKKNGRRPVVQLYLDDFLLLIDQSKES